SQHSLDQGFDRRDVDATQEGVVIWGDPMLIDPYGLPVVAKRKHPRRREAIPAAPQVRSRESPEDFARRVVLQERISHAIDHLRSSGRLPEDASAARELICRRVIQDVAREVEEYQEALGKFGKKAVRQALEAEVARRLEEKPGL